VGTACTETEDDQGTPGKEIWRKKMGKKTSGSAALDRAEWRQV